MTLFVEVMMLTLNVLTIGLLIIVVARSFGRGRRGYEVMDDRARWASAVMGSLFAVTAAAALLIIYWLGYVWTGFPSWMRWLIG